MTAVDSARLCWADLFLSSDMSPSEAVELQTTVWAVCYRVQDRELDAWVEVILRIAYVQHGPVHLFRVGFLMEALCPHIAATFLGDSSAVAIGSRLIASLERLTVSHRIARVGGEVFEPMSLLDTLART